jgi:hypothetical protein
MQRKTQLPTVWSAIILSRMRSRERVRDRQNSGLVSITFNGSTIKSYAD